MPHPESERRRDFLRYTLGQNAAAYSRDTLADMANELKFLDELYEMGDKKDPPERDPDLLANEVVESDLKSSEISIDAGKFNS